LLPAPATDTLWGKRRQRRSQENNPLSQTHPETSQRDTLPLKAALLGLIVVMAVVCAAVHWHTNAQIHQMLATDGFTPFPGGPNGAMPLYWINHPGHLLRIAGVADPGIGVTVVLILPGLFFAVLGWGLRQTPMPYIIAPVAIAFSILLSGAFFEHVEFPTDISVNQDTGLASSQHPVASLSDITGITIQQRHGVRGSLNYALVAHLKSGHTADLTVLQTQDAAEAVLQPVSAAIRRP